jgi:hypothetical protein
MKPVLKQEEADLLTDAILQKIVHDLPLETLTSQKKFKPKTFSWITKMAATFTLIFLSVTAVQEGKRVYPSTIHWNTELKNQIVETPQKEPQLKSKLQEVKTTNSGTHPEILVAHLEYDQPIKEGPVVFEAGESITLKPGFKVEAGVTFTAAIVNNQALSLE